MKVLEGFHHEPCFVFEYIIAKPGNKRVEMDKSERGNNRLPRMNHFERDLETEQEYLVMVDHVKLMDHLVYI